VLAICTNHAMPAGHVKIPTSLREVALTFVAVVLAARGCRRLIVCSGARGGAIPIGLARQIARGSAFLRSTVVCHRRTSDRYVEVKISRCQGWQRIGAISEG